MKSPLLKKIKPASSKEGLRLNRRVVIFLICLGVSSFFWLIQAISQRYDITVSFPVKYVNIPKNKVVANPLPKKIEVTINTEGYKYLVYKFLKKEKTLLLDITDLKRWNKANHYYILTNKNINNISTQLSKDIKAISISPDTIFINFDKKASKKVPVKTDITISYEEFHQPEGPLKIIPETVTIAGAKELIDSIRFIETEPVELLKVKENISVDLKLRETPEIKLVEITPSTIKAKQRVAKYTEVALELPIEFKNIPKNYSIKTFPDKVTVKFNVAQENYEKVKQSDFRVIVNVADASPESSKLKVELEKYPKIINSPKVNPDKVEFILRK